ncbi:MAG TPA: nitroreductase family protein, partial [Novosphingobium sp.]|nr:nitroreductase family protein [Novosphingobium sp.]
MTQPAERLAERYRQPADQPPGWNATIDALLAHRSVRAYLPDALAPGTVELLVAAAQSAASSSNLQPWSVVAVEDPARKARLAALAGHQTHLEQAPLLLIWLVDLNRLDTIGQQRGEPTEALAYLETFLLGAVDTALAAQNAVVAAESLGLGTVYVGAIRNRPVEVAAELALAPQVFALFGLAVGHPDPARPAAVKPRLPQAAVLSREAYGNPQAPAAIAAYDAHLEAFQREQGL